MTGEIQRVTINPEASDSRLRQDIDLAIVAHEINSGIRHTMNDVTPNRVGGQETTYLLRQQLRRRKIGMGATRSVQSGL